jgi:septum formation protein
MSAYRNQKGIILASQSPRRRYLLEHAGLKFKIIPSDLDENTIPQAAPAAYAYAIAEAKAARVAHIHPDWWVIGADTIVVVDETICGKPNSLDEARKMLMLLDGRTHQVITGYSIQCRGQNYSYTEAIQTDVEFKRLNAQEIEWYLQTGEPFDKAGAYAIQGIGTFLVRRINGSYSNVVGLPVCEVIEKLIKLEIIGADRNPLTIDSN